MSGVEIQRNRFGVTKGTLSGVALLERGQPSVTRRFLDEVTVIITVAVLGRCVGALRESLEEVALLEGVPGGVMTEFLKAVSLFEEEGASVMSEFLNGVRLLEEGVTREFLDDVTVLERCLSGVKEFLEDVTLLGGVPTCAMRKFLTGKVHKENSIGVMKRSLSGVAEEQPSIMRGFLTGIIAVLEGSHGVLKRSLEDIALLEGGVHASIMKEFLNAVVLVRRWQPSAMRRFLKGEVAVLERSISISALKGTREDEILLERVPASVMKEFLNAAVLVVECKIRRVAT